MQRRSFIAGMSLSLCAAPAARAESFTAFLARLRARALAAGIPAGIVHSTTAGLTPNADVLKHDQHQAEFTLTWADYSARVLSATRIAGGQAKHAADAPLLAAVTSRFGVSAEALVGIWGIETGYGSFQGSFHVIDALATLAWDRQSKFFAGQAIDAMRIVARRDAPAGRLLGSYAGAMGQPQFMPGVYLSTAVSFAGDGAPDIWNSDADSLASIGNYLAKAGWQTGLPSSESVLVPTSIDPAQTGRQAMRTLDHWQALGVQRLPGAMPLPGATQAALLLPDGPGGQAFLVYANFSVIRRYNPSDFYALAVGALGRMVLTA
ncbi:lytic transglycosylase domain-containing protein [Acidocella sp. KAb 2-4]|uniref:lytic murein transglycosylase n=1 Tax=Acidocella sp. KAb 2-4 TaxID=2885158 RepID=UPI001D0738C6|nr:lytic murein transglycosylase [Acidocella sp. KAb 2-4]MCB5943249.1 lytic murein transglycosylase [Acidocella sp. KAb 2-4]